MRILPWAWLLCAAPCCGQPAATLEKALSGVRSIATLHCSAIRKQSFDGEIKTVRLDFYFDRQGYNWAYVYAAPYAYTFAANDSMLRGVNRKTKTGYCVKNSVNGRRYRELVESTHLLAPLLQFTRMDTLAVDLKASVDNFLYFQRPTATGSEGIKVDAVKNSIRVVETFDETGCVRWQTFCVYDTVKAPQAAWPVMLVSKRIVAGSIQIDSLLFTKIEIDKKIKASVFDLPPFDTLPAAQ